jgi:hypothetical protein
MRKTFPVVRGRHSTKPVANPQRCQHPRHSPAVHFNHLLYDTFMQHPDHESLLALVACLPSDFEPFGERSRDTDWGPDCSRGCRWWLPLHGKLGSDWGVCSNPVSPRRSLLTFEHQGCREFEPQPLR